MCDDCQDRPRRKRGRDCNWCHNQKFVAQRAARRAKRRQALRAKRRQALRLEAIAAYGGECVWCGEQDPDVLVLDHVYDDGAAQRRELGNAQVYADARRRGYPTTYQLLCANDNMRKERARLGWAGFGSSGA